jgi:hypothetical protein
VDATVPTITNTSPAPNAENVPATTKVEATFSEAMDQSTIKEATFALEKLVANGTGGFDGEPVFATVDYDAGTKTATLNPEESLHPGAFYHACVGNCFGTDVKDLAGNKLEIQSWRFTVADTRPPAAPVISSPANDSYDTDGTIAFSGTAEANSTVKIFEGTTLKASTTASTDGSWSETLGGVANGRHTYTARATDAANNTSAPSAPRTVTVDITKPKVVTAGPAAREISPRANVTAVFSEPMEKNTIDGATFTLVRKGTSAAVPAEVTYSAASSEATLDPARGLKRGAVYRATVTAGAGDLAGNALDQDPNRAGEQQKAWSFTVRK